MSAAAAILLRGWSVRFLSRRLISVACNRNNAGVGLRASMRANRVKCISKTVSWSQTTVMMLSSDTTTTTSETQETALAPDDSEISSLVQAVSIGARTTSDDYVDLDRFISYLKKIHGRTGRITFADIAIMQRKWDNEGKTCTPESAMFMLEACGASMVDFPRAERNRLALKFWKKLEDSGVNLHIGHVNRLLLTHLENEHDFSPKEILAWMRSKKMSPNKATFRCLIASCCQGGDIAGATTFLEEMKMRNMAIDTFVFRALIEGHCRVGDVKSAEAVLNVMEQSGITVELQTHVTYCLGLIQAGKQWSEVAKLLETAMDSDRFQITEHDIFHLVIGLVRAKDVPGAKEALKYLPNKTGFFQLVRNVIPQLLYEGETDFALELYGRIAIDSEKSRGDFAMFVLRPLVFMETPLPYMMDLIKSLMDKYKQDIVARVLQACIEMNKIEYGRELSTLARAEFGEDAINADSYKVFLRMVMTRISGTEQVMNFVSRLNELGITPDSRLLSLDIIPALIQADVGKGQSVLPTLWRLRKSLVFNSKIDKPLTWTTINNAALRWLLNCGSQERFDQALECAVKTKLSLMPGFWYSSLSRSYLETGDLETFIAFIFLIRMSDPEQTWLAMHLTTIHQLAHRSAYQADKSADQVLNNVLIALERHKLGLTRDVCDSLRSIVEDEAALEQLSKLQDLQAQHSIYWTNERISEKLKEVVEISAKRIENVDDRQGALQAIDGLVESLSEEQLETMYEKQLSKEHYSFSVSKTLMDAYLERGGENKAGRLLAAIIERDLDHPKKIHSKVVFDRNINVIDHLIRANLFEDAIDIILTMVQKDLLIPGQQVALIGLRMLELGKHDKMKDFFVKVSKGRVTDNSQTMFGMLKIPMWIAETEKDADRVRDELNFLFKLGFLEKNTSATLSPLVMAHIHKGDLSGATEEYMRAYHGHRCVPASGKLLRALIAADEKDKTKEVIVTVNAVFGKINTGYTLATIYFDQGRYSDAKVYLETDTLPYSRGKVQAACKYFIKEKRLEALDAFVDCSRHIIGCDRPFVYTLLVEAHLDNGEKLQDIWLKMQEEGVAATDELKTTLAQGLERAGLKVPFDVPRSWIKNSEKQLLEPRVGKVDSSRNRASRKDKGIVDGWWED
jgi:leucine-rich PPR motif-containing protein